MTHQPDQRTPRISWSNAEDDALRSLCNQRRRTIAEQLKALHLGRHAILIELNPAYAAMAERRIKGDAPMLAQVEAVA